MQESISIEGFTELCKRAFRNRGFTAEETQACTEEIVEAQCRGINSHGAAMVSSYVKFKNEGTQGPIEVLKETPVSALLRGNNNAGPAVARRAMDLAMEKAKSTGVGFVGANNRSPFILAGHNSRRAAREGLIGISFSAGGVIEFPAYGGTEPVMASNPIGVAVPTRNGPVVLDMAFSSLRLGGGGSTQGMRRYMELGSPLPEGAALDKDGLPTTDPQKALEGIAMCFGGHKGASLSLMLDLIGRPLVGGKIDNAEPRIRSMTFIALRADLFVDQDGFLDDVGRLVERVRGSRPRPGFERVFLPGEPEERFVESTRRQGIPITAERIDDKTAVGIERKVYDELVRLASG